MTRTEEELVALSNLVQLLDKTPEELRVRGFSSQDLEQQKRQLVDKIIHDIFVGDDSERGFLVNAFFSSLSNDIRNINTVLFLKKMRELGLFVIPSTDATYVLFVLLGTIYDAVLAINSYNSDSEIRQSINNNVLSVFESFMREVSSSPGSMEHIIQENNSGPTTQGMPPPEWIPSRASVNTLNTTIPSEAPRWLYDEEDNNGRG